MNARPDEGDPVCPRYQDAAELVGRRWSAAVIRVTLDGPARFTHIQQRVDGLSARLLTQRLRELEDAGIVERVPGPAGAVRYSLTNKGRALARVITELERWSRAWT